MIYFYVEYIVPIGVFSIKVMVHRLTSIFCYDTFKISQCIFHKIFPLFYWLNGPSVYPQGIIIEQSEIKYGLRHVSKIKFLYSYCLITHESQNINVKTTEVPNTRNIPSRFMYSFYYEYCPCL